MKPKRLQRVPVLIGFGLFLLLTLLRFAAEEFIERFERPTFDLRVRTALRFQSDVATNFGFAFIDEATVAAVHNGRFGYRYGLYWPRQIYGRIINELSAQGANLIGLDVLFGELRPDHPPVALRDQHPVESDEFFAAALSAASNVIVAASPDLVPPALFATNALALGDVSSERDKDGILRRARAFQVIRRWHPTFLALEADPEYGVDLRQALVQSNRIVLPRPSEAPITIPLDETGNFDLRDFVGERLPAGVAQKAHPFTEERVWHMGLVLAARALGLDLATAQVDLPGGRIRLIGRSGIERIIPVDNNGFFLIDWSLPVGHPALMQQPVYELLQQDFMRTKGETNALSSAWQGRLVVVGSAALANDLTDRGATPLSKDTLLASTHWNVANSLLTGRFIRRWPTSTEVVASAAAVLLAIYLSWCWRPANATLAALVVLLSHLSAAVVLYLVYRVWIPIVLPSAGLLLGFAITMTCRVSIEQTERRRVRALFSKMVSPGVVQELLSADRLSLGGVRREISVFFSDVRGFTELTEAAQQEAELFVRANGLSGPAAEACFDEQARRTLETVNLYLSAVANVVISHHGTLDKFIGDCVMAFWGAPLADPAHAACAVRAAIAAQRAVHKLNEERARENALRTVQNQARTARGEKPMPLLPILYMGSGINSGMATAGLMGSAEAESLSYTVFGREVNLAARLESASGSGRIFISRPTYELLIRHEPALAAQCEQLNPLEVKGFRAPVEVFSVPWLENDTSLVGASSDAGS